MQSNKASKKTSKNAKEPVVAPSVDAGAASEKTAKQRTPKSSAAKSEPVKTTPAKRHRKAAAVSAPEPAVHLPVEAPKAMAATAGGRASVSRERVEELAYQYWIADGRPHGNHFDHWIRAERDLGLVG